MFGALKRGRFRSLASLILVVNVVGELQQKRTLAASRAFLAAARLSCCRWLHVWLQWNFSLVHSVGRLYLHAEMEMAVFPSSYIKGQKSVLNRKWCVYWITVNLSITAQKFMRSKLCQLLISLPCFHRILLLSYDGSWVWFIGMLYLTQCRWRLVRCDMFLWPIYSEYSLKRVLRLRVAHQLLHALTDGRCFVFAKYSLVRLVAVDCR